MKTLSEKQLREKAVEVFEFNKEADELHATSDGQFFYQESPAKLHARQAGKPGTPLKVYKILRQEEEEEKEGEEVSWQQRVKNVQAATTVAEAEALLEGETAKSVLEAGEARIAELKKEAETDERNKTED